MKKALYLILIFHFSIIFMTYSSHKVYLVHGYAGQNFEFIKIEKAINKKGFVCETFSYNSFKQEVDSVSKSLFDKIINDDYDTISFVAHSMGALVVRSLYQYIDTGSHFPFIHRFVMIASPNKGTPLADYWGQFEFLRFILGPNVHNLTTDPETGAPKYPIPSCEVGLIIGVKGDKKGYNHFLKGDNDGVIPAKNTILGIEKELVYVNAPHFGMPLNKKVVMHTVNFLTNGSFKDL